MKHRHYKIGYDSKRRVQVMACGSSMRYPDTGTVTTIKRFVTCPYCLEAMEPKVETPKTGRYKVTYKDKLDGIVTTVFEDKQQMDSKLDYLNSRGRLLEVVYQDEI